MEGLTRGVGIFIVRNLVIGLDAFSGACSENFPKMVAIIPVTTFYSLASSLASLVVLAYLADNMSHLLAVITLERKWLDIISKLLGNVILQLTGPETSNKPVDVGKSFSLLGISLRTCMGRVGRQWSLKGEVCHGVVTLPVDGWQGHLPGLEIELWLRGTGQDGAFPGYGASSLHPLLQALPFFFLRQSQH